MMYAARESDSSLKSSPLIMRLDSVYSFRFFSNPKLVLFCTGIDLAPGVGTCIHCQLGTLFVSEATTPSSHFELWTQGANVGDRPTHFGTFPATAERQNSAILAILVHSTIEELCSTSGPKFAQFDSMSTAFRATAKNDLWPISQCQRQPILAEGPCLASVCR